ncbi:unnamed protein product [Trifolium pratense]|uniref:Uncharacterized protein n=1 Tax=Trifolium pratense TaxID=57577 RepID=A0ACB0KLG1_TRIPR|nr:unnamed protein product [Trifolium pratense]
MPFREELLGDSSCSDFVPIASCLVDWLGLHHQGFDFVCLFVSFQGLNLFLVLFVILYCIFGVLFLFHLTMELFLELYKDGN